ncbi:divalent-cation tolerance protein CutA [Nitratifractor sp.]
MKENNTYAIVITTTDSEAEAKRLAKALLDARLAACIQILQIESLYRWEGSIEEATEYRLEIKTRAELFEKIERLVRDLHSYEVPEIIMLSIEEGSTEYLNWLDGEVGSRSEEFDTDGNDT